MSPAEKLDFIWLSQGSRGMEPGSKHSEATQHHFCCVVGQRKDRFSTDRWEETGVPPLERGGSYLAACAMKGIQP